jgi:hypothetical protein
MGENIMMFYFVTEDQDTPLKGAMIRELERMWKDAVMAQL